MPYAIKKAKGKDGYYVYGVDGKRHSKEPMELEMAKKQMTALNIAHAKMEKGVIAPVKKVRKTKAVAVEVVPVKKPRKTKAVAVEVVPVKKPRKTKVEKAVEVIAVPTKVVKKAIRSPIAKAKKVAKAVDVAKAVEVMTMTGKKGMHSPAGVLAPLVSETTGGGSGLANDAHWVSAVKSGGRKPSKVE